MDSKICVTVKHNMVIKKCASVDVLNFADQRPQILSCTCNYHIELGIKKHICST